MTYPIADKIHGLKTAGIIIRLPCNIFYSKITICIQFFSTHHAAFCSLFSFYGKFDIACNILSKIQHCMSVRTMHNCWIRKFLMFFCRVIIGSTDHTFIRRHSCPSTIRWTTPQIYPLSVFHIRITDTAIIRPLHRSITHENLMFSTLIKDFHLRHKFWLISINFRAVKDPCGTGVKTICQFHGPHIFIFQQVCHIIRLIMYSFLKRSGSRCQNRIPHFCSINFCLIQATGCNVESRTHKIFFFYSKSLFKTVHRISHFGTFTMFIVSYDKRCFPLLFFQQSHFKESRPAPTVIYSILICHRYTPQNPVSTL